MTLVLLCRAYSHYESCSVYRAWCLASTMALSVLIAGAVHSLLKSLISSRFGYFCF